MQIWWLTTYGSRQWSAAEREARRLLYAVAVGIFIVLFFIGLWILEVWFASPWATLISIAIAGYSALFISRFVCGQIWPRLFQEADKNAANRLGTRRI